MNKKPLSTEKSLDSVYAFQRSTEALSSASVVSDSPNQSDETRVGNWQSDPAHITTPRVQLWSQSGTMRGVISSELAVQLVNDKTHFVISCQAIGEI